VPENYNPELSCHVVCVILCSAVWVKHPVVTDGQTDTHRAIAYTALARCLVIRYDTINYIYVRSKTDG